MKKPQALRDQLTSCLYAPDGALVFQRDPTKLHLFVGGGGIAARFGGSPGFAWQYDLRLVITDYPADCVDALMLAIVMWLQINEPTVLLNHQLGDEAVKVEAEIIDHQTVDLRVTLRLSEAVDAVPRDGGGFDLVERTEPDPIPGFTDVPDGVPLDQIWVDDRLLIDFTPETP